MRKTEIRCTKLLIMPTVGLCRVVLRFRSKSAVPSQHIGIIGAVLIEDLSGSPCYMRASTRLRTGSLNSVESGVMR